MIDLPFNFYMKIKVTILFLLVLFRVIFIPIWFTLSVNDLHKKATVFEQIRLHKRRSLYSDDMSLDIELCNSYENCVSNFPKPKFNLRTSLGLEQLSIQLSNLFPKYSFQGFFLLSQCLFLRHRVLRI